MYRKRHSRYRVQYYPVSGIHWGSRTTSLTQVRDDYCPQLHPPALILSPPLIIQMEAVSLFPRPRLQSMLEFLSPASFSGVLHYRYSFIL